ncbi:hypothetical protein [Nonomuraea sp. NPDC049784]|uniref:hypothetical protein n=1 Tax=Nonomuraea sp. NPDC049784 TaxID=3154361 RepID=UPI0033E2C7FE
MLLSGQIDIDGLEPHPNRYRLALLKHAYLAECMKKGILEGPRADQIRHELIAARDASTREDIPASASAFGLTVLRVHEEKPVTPALVVPATVHTAAGPVDGVLFLGQIFVSWPSFSPDGEAFPQQRVLVRFGVEEPLAGVVQAVTR